MSDLERLMEKLRKKPEAEEETPQEEEEKLPLPMEKPKTIPKPSQKPSEPQPPKVEEPKEEETEVEEEEKPIPAKMVEENPIESEILLLQNNGIYRRERILAQKEQVDVLKVIAQTLLDLKERLCGEDGEKKNKK